MRPDTLAVLLGATLATSGLLAQQVVSARAGMVHYIEGDVLLDDKPVKMKFAQFPEVKENSVLRTESGRAEVLLGPGVILRMPENSAFRMTSSDLADTRVELLEGSILVECTELLKENSVRIHFKESTVSLLKNGLYRVSSDSGDLRVYDGRATAVRGDQTVSLKKGRLLALAGTGTQQKFDTEIGDPLYRWSARRSGYLAMANVSSARSLQDEIWGISGWRWNPWFGMFTFVPYSRVLYSPFGWAFYSPSEVLYLYRPRVYYSYSDSGYGGMGGGPRWNADLGYSTVGSRSYGGNAGMAVPSGGAPAAAPGGDAGGARSAPDATPRGGEGGGRGQ